MDMKKIILGLAAVFLCIPKSDAAVVKLSVKDAVGIVLQSGNERKLIDFTYQRSEFPLYQALGLFDPTFSSSYSYDKSRLESFSGLTNPEDRTTVWKAGISKKFPTGTVLSTEYSRTQQDSILNSFTAGLRPAKQVMDQFDISLRQNILGNFFGVLDRGAVDNAERVVQRSELEKHESTEDLVIRVVRAYWDAFAAKESFQEAMRGREKYRQLVVSLKRKFGRGIDDDRAELPKAQAELTNQERAVKSVSLVYLNALDTLFNLMNIPPASDVEFVVPQRLPNPPASEDDRALISKLRKVAVAKLNLENAASERRAARLGNLPSLDILSRTTFNGVEANSGKAFADMSNGNHPRYMVGVELIYKFGSELARGERALKEVQFMESEVLLEKTKLDMWDRLERTSRDVKAKYLVASEAEEAVASWEKAVLQQERNFRVGRTSTAELIQDYSSLFRAQAARSAALSDYHVAIQEYAAARDRIVEK